MPYDFTLLRIHKCTNEVALSLNKQLALALVTSFSEVVDPHPSDSPYYFLNKELEIANEFPELHFHLEAVVLDYHFTFYFWKDYILIELGAGNHPVSLFHQVRKYASRIADFGYKVESPLDNCMLDMEEGIAANIQAYHQWNGLVENVVDNINKEDDMY
jgi:hypothetical protein